MYLSYKGSFDVTHSLQPQARTATANGTGVDLSTGTGATAVIVVGAWTDGSHVITIGESDDNSTFTTVAAADLEGALPTISSAGTASQSYRIGYKGAKRYIRVTTTASGTTTGAVYGAIIVRHQTRVQPK